MNTEQQTVAYRLSQPRFFLYSNLDSNIHLVIEAVYQNQIEPDLMWREDILDDVISRCVEGSTFGNSFIQIAPNPKIRAALDGVYERYPRFGRNTANDQLIIEAASRYQINFDAQHLVQMVTDDNNLFQSLALSAEHQQKVADVRQRDQWIAALTNNGTTNFTVDRKTYDAKGFEIQFSSSGGRRKVAGDGGFLSWTDEQVKYAYDQTMMKRGFIEQAEKGTLRKTVNTLATQARIDKYHGDPGAYKPPMPTSETQAAVLIDPRNGNPITTRKQLIAYITSDRNALALLVRNRQGVTVPERALAVDRLLATK